MCECESCNCEGVNMDQYESLKHEMRVVYKRMEFLDEMDYFEIAATLEEMEDEMRKEDEEEFSQLEEEEYLESVRALDDFDKALDEFINQDFERTDLKVCHDCTCPICYADPYDRTCE